MPPPKDVHQARLVQVIEENSKSLERMGWKNMDYEEYTDGFLSFLKGLGRVAPQNSQKSDFLAALAAAKLSLTAAEAALLAEKTKGAISYARKRARDAGSGKFLPSSIQALLRVWSRNEKVTKTKALDNKARAPLAPPPGQPTSSMGIRDVFALGEKQKPTKIDLTSNASAPTSSSSSSSSNVKIAIPTSSGASSSSALPAGSRAIPPSTPRIRLVLVLVLAFVG